MADQNPWEINYSPVSGAPPSPPRSTTGYAFKGLAGTEPIVLPRVTQQAAAASSAGGAKEPWEIEYQTPPAPPPPTFLEQTVINPLKDLGAGVLSGGSSVNRMLANAADMANSLATSVGSATGTTPGGLFQNVSQWARQGQIDLQKRAEQLAGGRTDFPSQLYRGIGQGAAELPAYALAGEVAGPAAGIAAVSGITEADKGWKSALQAAATGGLTGGALTVLGPASRPIRLIGAAAMTYAQSRLVGEDNATALARATTMGAMAGLPPGGTPASDILSAARETIPGLDTVATAAERTAAAAKAGVTAAAPDVAKGAAKVGLAYGASYLPIPAEIKYGVGIPTAGSGAKQIFSGLKTGVNAARTSLAETAAPEAAAAPEAGAASAAAAPATAPVGAPTDDALIHLYSVETDPVKRGALQKELTDRGLMQQPGAAPWNTSALNPYRSYSQDALRNVYRVEQDPVKRALIEQTAADRNLSLLNRDARRATAAVPETGYPETPGPSLTQDDALMLRYLGEKDPMAANAETIGIARQYAAAAPELMARLRAGDVEPIVAPAEQTAPAAQKPVELNLAYDAPGVSPPAPEPAAVPASGGTAAASPALTAPTPTAGQVYAEANGENWARLSPKNRLLMEQLAQAHANAAEASLEEATRPAPPTAPGITPPAAPQTPPAAPEPPAPAPATPAAPGAPVAAALTPAQQAAAGMRAAMGLGDEEFRPPGTEAPDVSAIVRAKQIDLMAQKLQEAGIGSGDAQKMDPPDLALLARAAGIDEPIGVVGRDVVTRLKTIEQQTAEAAKYEAAYAKLSPARKAAIRADAEPPAAPAAPPPTAQPQSLANIMRGTAPSTDLEGQLADSVAAAKAGKRVIPEPVPEGEMPRTASQERIEKLAQFLFEDKRIDPVKLAALPSEPDALLQLEELGRTLGIKGRPAPGEPQAIVDRVRELRGESLRKPPASATTAATRRAK